VNRLRRFLHRPRTRGQALVELAIILPVLLLVVLMALDLGRVFFGWVGLNNAARIGASYAAAHPTAWVPPGNSIQQANYEAQILADANALNCALPGTIPDPVFAGGTGLGESAHVTLTCDFSLLTPLVSQILGGSITIQAESIFPIRTGMIGGVPAGPSLPSPAPTASASSSADPSATPVPTPRMCVAPSFIGDSLTGGGGPGSALQVKWTQAGFTTQLNVNPPRGGVQTVGSQSPLVGGQSGPCDTTIETVGP
jgi:hypothetical protein